MLTASLERLEAQAGECLLDLGCGFGRHAYAGSRHGMHVIALDSGRDEVAGVRDTWRAMREAEEISAAISTVVVRGDARSIPLRDESIDRVICSEVLEHIPDDVAVMKELWRVLRPGGTIAVTVPRRGPELINWSLSDAYHQVAGGHIRIYSRRQLESRLMAAGFSIRGHHYAHGLHAPYWWLKCFVGTQNDRHWMVRLFHRLLVWDIMRAPRVTRQLDAMLNPLMGKSLVVYAVKSDGA